MCICVRQLQHYKQHGMKQGSFLLGIYVAPYHAIVATVLIILQGTAKKCTLEGGNSGYNVTSVRKWAVYPVIVQGNKPDE